MGFRDAKTPPRPRQRPKYIQPEERPNTSTAPLMRISIRVAKSAKRHPVTFILILVLVIAAALLGKDLPPWIGTLFSNQ